MPQGYQHKFLSPAQVAAAFRHAPVDTGWLSPGVVRAGSTAQGDFAVLFIPAQKHRLLIETARGGKLQQLELFLPPLVFAGHAQNFRVWAIKERDLKPTSALYHAPLPNVFDNGSICWGTNTVPRASAGTICEAWAVFITSPFNGHAASGKAQSHRQDVRTLLRRLSRARTKFPLAELMPRHETLDARFGQMLGGGDH